MWFKGLVSAACVAVLITIGWISWQEFFPSAEIDRETCLAALAENVKAEKYTFDDFLNQCRDADLISIRDVGSPAQ